MFKLIRLYPYLYHHEKPIAASSADQREAVRRGRPYASATRERTEGCRASAAACQRPLPRELVSKKKHLRVLQNQSSL